MNFSKDSVEKLKPREKVYVVSDGKVPVLKLRVQPSGAKTYFFQFMEDGKLNKGTIGDARLVSLDEARKMALARYSGQEEEVKKVIQAGVLKISALCQKFRKEYVPTKRATTQKDYLAHSEWIDKNFGHLPVNSIDRATAKAILQKATTRPPKKDKKTKKMVPVVLANGTINRWRATFSKMWAFALQEYSEHDVEANPFMTIKKLEENNRIEEYAREKELKAILDSILQEENLISRAYHGTILYTLCRRGEADKMRWRDIEGDIWVKKSSDTKGKETHRVKLVKQVFDLLEPIRVGGPDDFVFQCFQGWGKAWKRILNRAGLPYPGIRVHDLRGSCAIWLLQNEMATIEDISKMLGHKDTGITQRRYLPQVSNNSKVAEAMSTFG